VTAPTAELLRENEELRHRLEEAEETLRAIRNGEVDAVLVEADRARVFTLESTDRPYRLLVEQMTQGAAALTVEGSILYCNRHFTDLLGQPLEALLGQPVHRFVSPAARPLFEALLRDGRAGGSQGEVALLRADGAVMPCYLGVNVLREGAAGLCLMVTDLSEQKRHEALVASEALARAILEQAVDAVVVCDAAGKVVLASQGAYALAGDNPLLRSFAAAFPLRPTAPAGDVSLEAVLGGATLRGLDVWLEGRDGRRDLLLSAGPLRDAGRPAGAVVTLTDITERKRAHDELERRVEQRTAALREAQAKAVQAERLAAVGQMVAGLAHESRNALQRIQACLSVLAFRLEGRPDELDLLARMQRAQDDLHRLYEEVRGYAAPVQLDRRRCRLAAVWREAWQDLGPQRLEKKADRLEESGEVECECLADPFQLRQVFRNLLENAVAAAADPPRVEVRCWRDRVGGQDVVRVAVRDNGPGFAPEQQGRLFEPFYTTKVQGTGLGLAICKRVVEAHGGGIEVGAGPGGEVIVTLPWRTV
jgi:PAS domain S-box-containing protein